MVGKTAQNHVQFQRKSRYEHLFLQPTQCFLLTVSMKFQVSHLWMTGDKHLSIHDIPEMNWSYFLHFFFKLLRWCNNTHIPKTQRKINDLFPSVQKCTECYPIYKQCWLQSSPFSSVTWCREARERVQLSSLEQAGNSSSITTWSAGWNFPWASKNER